MSEYLKNQNESVKAIVKQKDRKGNQIEVVEYFQHKLVTNYTLGITGKPN